MLTSGHYQKGLSAFCTPSTPQQLQSTKTFEWHFSNDQNQKDVFTQLINEHLKNSTIMQTPATPSIDINGLNKTTRGSKEENDDEQNFYSSPSSRMFYLKLNFEKKNINISFYLAAQQQDNSLSLFSNRSVDKLENWFGTSIYTNVYPCMPSDRVLSACDLEQ